ncbi:radial spoke head protein 9 homolog [Anopheles ziemanni]|uniref:radial spoke head protein 9 homolog n=1 Tax=Anopheles coustani TaxID=139045 RepID=UPI002659AAAC|nr:radial spoke head protein 9 homolog [Anopheles coustani]XP_058173928.1 radial spoke head protein 9 homolog [Anopheles ziemanni]
MEISQFSESVPYLANFFRTIPKPTQLKLAHSLLLLKNSQRLRTLFYLGRLEAHSNAYHLAFGSPEEDLFREQKFFFSQNGTVWYLLLEPAVWSEDWGRLHQEFTGNLGYIVKYRPERDGSTGSVKVREQDRLWYVVHAILREAAFVPRGAMRWSTGGEAVLNPFFRGLSESELCALSNYQHFRQPERAAEENLRGRAECDLPLDVFDRPEVDVLPEGKSFALRVDDTGTIATWSSLYWIGLVNYHRADRNVYGFFYAGDGRKNWDLPFMVDL